MQSRRNWHGSRNQLGVAISLAKCDAPRLGALRRHRPKIQAQVRCTAPTGVFAWLAEVSAKAQTIQNGMQLRKKVRQPSQQFAQPEQSPRERRSQVRDNYA